jgi:hypothetical protein
VKNWFQAFAFKWNLYRYSAVTDEPPEHPAMQVVSSHPNVRYPVMRDPPLKDQTVLAEPPRWGGAR